MSYQYQELGISLLFIDWIIPVQQKRPEELVKVRKYVTQQVRPGTFRLNLHPQRIPHGEHFNMYSSSIDSKCARWTLGRGKEGDGV